MGGTPVIIKCNNRLIAFAEQHSNKYVRTICKYSDDEGLSWSDKIYVTKNEENIYGNPVPIYLSNDNKIVTLVTMNYSGDSEEDIIEGKSKNVRYVYKVESYNNGITWNDPVKIDNVRKSDWRWYATGPSCAIQLQCGRIVVPCNHSEKNGKYYSHLIYSDNLCEDWRIKELGIEGSNETTICELPLNMNNIFINMRNENDNFKFVAILSENFKDIAIMPNFYNVPICQGNCINFNSSILFSTPVSDKRSYNKDKRSNLTIFSTLNNGKSWCDGKVIYEGLAAYSCMVKLNDKCIGIVYEKNNYSQIVFKKIKYI